ncbi:myo-inositol-1(or 4)-monophosphatase [Palleronia marisminoris]|uniref:Inositol-1-monophosphatase n=1 Tax=Palleronia marisminoris TaxID=315423 RepID=A0A1Y5RJ85_9RHOB|nr:inositol monophosphatase family protein [Palleronia marisminoris]SFG23755.1 myo-inositol-1(or 4)-monophosphatase [Palleronia marisminoris]SLN18601.1 Inositol-1-monophosphatase [Palleronia marisminoris]
MQGSANLTIMVKAARAAARQLVRDFREVENLQVSVKGTGDFVSRADIAAEETIRNILTSERPNYGWMGEESAEVEGKDPTRRWIVDPLDGTTNFLHGLPHWAISIALEHKGEIVSAVIYDPAKDEMFWAERGAGAFMNDQRLRVSGRTKMIESLFATGLPWGSKPELPLKLRDLGRILPATSGVRRFGVASLDLAYVAAGRYDGYWERGIEPWDVAAGLLIVREAGGFAEALAGEDVFTSRTVVSGNAGVFEAFAKELRKTT